MKIDKTYVINLSHRVDKREHMENEFQKLNSKGINLNHIFFSAINGNSDLDLSPFTFKTPNWFDPNSGKAMTNGEVGCALSHYSIWKDIVSRVNSGSLPIDCKVLILEDDVIFTNDFNEKLKEYTSEISFDYDMLYIHRKPLYGTEETKMSPHIVKNKKSYWTCGYILTYSGASKLANDVYLDNLIPVDEYLPIMYGCKIFGYEKKYEHCEKINCYAISPSLLKLTQSAFYDSDTFHSKAYLDNKEYIFNSNKKFSIIYIGPFSGDSYFRFIDYCKLYALHYSVIKGNKSHHKHTLLFDELIKWDVEKLENTLLMVIDVNYDDHCGVIPIASPEEIVNKTRSLIDETKFLVAKSTNYHGKLLFCAWAKNIMNLLVKFRKSRKESINDISLSQIIRLYSDGNNINDNNYEIFQPLMTNDDIKFNHRQSRILNSQTREKSCIVFSDNNKMNILLNRIEDYTGNNWNEFYGYKISSDNSEETCMPKIYVSFNQKHNEITSRIINTLDYPDGLLTINGNKRTSISEDKFLQNDFITFLKTDCDYYFFVDDNCVIDNPRILRDLLKLNKSVVTPLLRRGEEAWSNFWGDLSDIGYYKRSFDYMDIINYRKQGCWNVPYVTGVYLIKREVIELNPSFLDNYKDMDIDMKICHHFRKNDIFMYVSNMDKYGYILKDSEIIPQSINNLGQVTLYDLFTRRSEWEQKYLHPEYLKHKNCLEKMNHIELCNDIYNFPLFSKEFCEEVIARAEDYGKWSKGKNEHKDPRLGKDYYENVPTVDIHLFELGFKKHWHEIVFSYIAPMARVLYNNYKTKSINIAFVVKYSFENQNSLPPHHDSSTYTVNIALNRGNGVDYDGGGCRFIRQNYVLKNQDPGMCCIHAGRLVAYHEGLPVTSGTRYILVSFIN